VGLFPINLIISTYLLIAVFICIYRLQRPNMQAIKLRYRLAGSLLFGVFWIFVLPFFLRDQLKISRYQNERKKLLRENLKLNEEYQLVKKALDDGLEYLTDDSSVDLLLSPVLSVENKFRELEASLSDNQWWLRRFGVEVSDKVDETREIAVINFSKSWWCWDRDAPKARFFKPLEKIFDLVSESTSPRGFDDDIAFSGARFQRQEPERSEEWTTYFTPSFKKDVASLDRKLAGRVMQAILDIASDPTGFYGDTQKPLSGPLKGQWRYRLGDYRVVYLPRPERFVIVFLRCSSRGEVYH